MTNAVEAIATPSDAALRMIAQLVSFDTTSRASNLGLIEWVRDHLAGMGVSSRLTYDATGTKANLFATIGEGRKPGIVLSGHSDVVPVDGQAWDTDPFQAVIRDGRLYARGSADMKGFIGVALSKVPAFLAADMDSAIHLALSYDEEVGCIGVRGLLADLEEQGLRPAGCVVGEPTMMQAIIAHKGKRDYVCCVRGREMHSALLNQGVNAIEYAAQLIVRIREIAQRMAQTEVRNYGFSVPYTTLQTGTIKGGIATNVVPRDCEFTFEFRYLPGTDPDRLFAEIRDYAQAELLPEMRRTFDGAEIRFAERSGAPGLDTAEDAAITQLVFELAQSRGRGVGRVDYGTEAGLFQRAGIPTIVCGPGSIEQAHKPNEFIALEQIAQCEAFMQRLIAQRASLAAN